MKSTHVVAAAVFAAVLVTVFPTRLGGQASDSQSQTASPSLPNELAIVARRKALFTDSTDLGELAKSVQNNQGIEFQTVMQLDQKATLGIGELDSAVWFI